MGKYAFLIVFIFAEYCGTAQVIPASVADTIYSVQLHEIAVKAKWRNDTERYRYNQMKYYVTTILPYVNAAARLFNEISAELDDPGISKKERRKFIGSKEDEMRTRFENKVKELNVAQGALLVKLIARQTDVNIYEMLTGFKNPFAAIKWQAWARLNGMNLDKKYQPEEEPALELIMEELGYPLPGSYVLNRK